MKLQGTHISQLVHVSWQQQLSRSAHEARMASTKFLPSPVMVSSPFSLHRLHLTFLILTLTSLHVCEYALESAEGHGSLKCESPEAPARSDGIRGGLFIEQQAEDTEGVHARLLSTANVDQSAVAPQPVSRNMYCRQFCNKQAELENAANHNFFGIEVHQ